MLSFRSRCSKSFKR